LDDSSLCERRRRQQQQQQQQQQQKGNKEDDRQEGDKKKKKEVKKRTDNPENCLSSSLFPSSFVVCESSFTQRRQIVENRLCVIVSLFFVILVSTFF